MQELAMIKLAEDIDLQDYTLILPSVAVGNVGQLSIDLLISSLGLKKVGSIWSSKFLPIAGLDPYDSMSNSLCTTIDIHVGSTRKLAVLQLRSPNVGKCTDFFQELTEFVRSKKIAKVVILSSSHDYERSDRSDSSIRFLAPGNLRDQLQSFGFKRHETTIQDQALSSQESTHISGGGFANELYDHFLREKIIAVVLFRYCSEGDNVSDALELTTNLNCWLKLLDIKKDIKYPTSWKYLFGNPPASELY